MRLMDQQVIAAERAGSIDLRQQEVCVLQPPQPRENHDTTGLATRHLRSGKAAGVLHEFVSSCQFLERCLVAPGRSQYVSNTAQDSRLHHRWKDVQRLLKWDDGLVIATELPFGIAQK